MVFPWLKSSYRCCSEAGAGYIRKGRGWILEIGVLHSPKIEQNYLNKEKQYFEHSNLDSALAPLILLRCEHHGTGKAVIKLGCTTSHVDSTIY